MSVKIVCHIQKSLLSLAFFSVSLEQFNSKSVYARSIASDHLKYFDNV